MAETLASVVSRVRLIRVRPSGMMRLISRSRAMVSTIYIRCRGGLANRSAAVVARVRGGERGRDLGEALRHREPVDLLGALVVGFDLLLQQLFGRERRRAGLRVRVVPSQTLHQRNLDKSQTKQ